ncbi:MAG: hypothetical protein FWE19_07160 [Oscillospiraceae bacterium]|nr:hypothetical protein [Oscillospiraceae bacterium]
MSGRLLALSLCLALLGACAPVDANIEDLLSPPRINERQTQVEQALSQHISLGDIQYQYPRDGDYRSPFIFSDMDASGLMAAMVFYTSAQSGGGIRVKVLQEQVGGDWQLIDDRAGFGDTVQIVRFANILTPYSRNLLVGWEDSGSGQRRLDVFSFRDGRLQTLYQTFYTVFDIDRFMPGALEQIALVRQDQLGNHHLDLLGRTPDGRLTDVGNVDLSVDIYQVLGLTRGNMRPGVSGIFVDARRFDAQLATEIFEVSGGTLFPLVADIDIETTNVLYRQTFRPLDPALLSVDLRGNGRVVVPIPHEEELPGQVIDTELELPLHLTLFMGYDYAGVLEVVDTAIVIEDAGYLFFFPPQWVGYVTVQHRPERDDWQFFEVNPATNLPYPELMRIRVSSIRDYRDPFLEEYIHLADRGIFRYYGYITNNSSPLSITQEEMERDFMLLRARR